MNLYALHDYSQALRQERGAFRIEPEEAAQYNSVGYGVFWTPNDFEGPRRKENLTRINYWFCELDGDKEDQKRRIALSPLLPSKIAESKNGYHLYWIASGATLENWKRVVRWGIVPALGADPKSSDVCRLLRAPFYLHLKDPEDPFIVRLVVDTPAVYTEEQMLRAFPDSREASTRSERDRIQGEGFWWRVASLDCRDAVERLSGHWLFDGERFRLEEQPNGNANIIREDDEYSTGCFVDRDGKLGNVDGGSSIAAYCRWYGHSWADVAKGLLEIWPELESDEEATKR